MECTFSKFGGMFVKIRVMMLVSLNEVWYMYAISPQG